MLIGEFILRTSVYVLPFVDQLHDHRPLRPVDQRDDLTILAAHVHQAEHDLALGGVGHLQARQRTPPNHIHVQL